MFYDRSRPWELRSNLDPALTELAVPVIRIKGNILEAPWSFETTRNCVFFLNLGGAQVLRVENVTQSLFGVTGTFYINATALEFINLEMQMRTFPKDSAATSMRVA